MKKDKPYRLGLLVSDKRDNGYYHIICRTVTIGRTSEDYEGSSVGANDLRNPNGRIFKDGFLWENFEIRCQGDPDSQRKGQTYGYDWSYGDIFSVGLRQAEAMAKTLRMVDRKMQRARETLGYVRTYGEFVTRVAIAIGAESIIFTTASRGTSYRDGEYQFLSRPLGGLKIDEMVAKWVKEAA